jgi:hypothetical protein
MYIENVGDAVVRIAEINHQIRVEALTFTTDPGINWSTVGDLHRERDLAENYLHRHGVFVRDVARIDFQTLIS